MNEATKEACTCSFGVQLLLVVALLVEARERESRCFLRSAAQRSAGCCARGCFGWCPLLRTAGRERSATLGMLLKRFFS